MSAIKRPVRAYAAARPVEYGWSVRDANNVRIGRDLSEAQAKQIALALNLHDALTAVAEASAQWRDEHKASVQMIDALNSLAITEQNNNRRNVISKAKEQLSQPTA